jgi:hypothetical protein
MVCKIAVYVRAPHNPSSRAIYILFLIFSDRSVNREIIYIPDLLNNPVLILFSTIYSGEFAIEYSTGKTYAKKSLIYKKIIYDQKNIC